MTVSTFHDKSHFEGVSGEPLVRTSDAERTGSVTERMRFMDACPIDKQPMGLLRYDLMTMYYFRRIPMCNVKGKKKQPEVCPSRCQLVRGEKGASRVQLFTHGCLPVTD